MSRPIKFRAWDGKKMLDNPKFEFFAHGRGGRAVMMANEDENVEIMQFTGLTDKNGKEIYEGDVMRKNYGEGAHDLEHVVVWKNGSLGYKPKYARSDEADFTSFERVANWGQMEVIGNVYQNPELLNP